MKEEKHYAQEAVQRKFPEAIAERGGELTGMWYIVADGRVLGMGTSEGKAWVQARFNIGDR